MTADISITLDGLGAGTGQCLERPFGDLDESPLHRWMFEHGEDNQAEVDAIVDAGAFVMGRNMFGPVRGEWDREWNGWWGENPPYHAPVFVLTHYPREPQVMEGGTTFHFVTEGVEAAIGLARAAAGDRNVAVAGGASTINSVLALGALDELRLHVVPFVSGLSEGSRMFDGVPALGLRPASVRQTPHVNHLTYVRG